MEMDLMNSKLDKVTDVLIAISNFKYRSEGELVRSTPVTKNYQLIGPSRHPQRVYISSLVHLRLPL